MCEVWGRYPATTLVQCCNEQGVAKLVRMAEILERGDDIMIECHGVPRSVTE